VINKFTIYGERCSGTYYLTRLISFNFDIKITAEYGYKHFFGFNDLTDGDDTLFIGLVREPVDWIMSFYNHPWHVAAELKGKGFDHFALGGDNKEFYSISDEGKEVVTDHHIFNGGRYRDVFELRATKCRFLLKEMEKSVKNYKLIRLEDLQKDYEKILTQLEKRFKLKRKMECLVNLENYKGVVGAPKYEKKHYNPEPHVLNLIHSNLDLKVEKEMGYKLQTSVPQPLNPSPPTISFCFTNKGRFTMDIGEEVLPLFNNCLLTLRNCLETLKINDYEIVISSWDNDEDYSMLNSFLLSNFHPTRFKIIRCNEGVYLKEFSRGGGRNNAFKHSSGKIVAFIDADMLFVRPTVIIRGIEYASKNEAYFPTHYTFLIDGAGAWQTYGWGNCFIPRHAMNNIEWVEKSTWGLEDDWFFEAVIKSGIKVKRKQCKGFVHQWHPAPRTGCTDPKALNFNAPASIDDGSCVYTHPKHYHPSFYFSPEFSPNPYPHHQYNIPNLVFTSAGDDTFFDELWLDKNRNYDVWVTYYGDNDEIYEKYKSKVDYIEKRKGSKFQNFHHIYTTKNLSKYKRFFILDDDIIISTEEINKMFKISEEASLWICQPSFDHKSKLGWIINKHRKEYYLRYTNFVEVNTPLFTKGALSKLMDHYSPELVEFGVDYLYIWANGLEERKKYAIIDTVQCHNPHNADGEGDKLSQHGMSIEDRVKVWEEYRKELNIPHWEHKTHQYVPWTKMQIELTKADFSKVVDIEFNKKLTIPPSTEDKIALLFLTRNNIKHPQLWYDFINDAKGKCNIYSHTKEKDLITQDFLKESQIPTHIETKWGDYSLVKAVNELIRVAVQDPTNKFFVLLCESSIPLHKFGPIYQFLFKNQKSILYTKITPPDKKELEKICKQIINPEQLNLTKDTIIRNSQWMIINREHAEIIGKHNHEEAFKNFPIADEWYHYNVLQYYDKDFSTKVLNFKPTYFQYDLKDFEDPLPHPLEVTDKELIGDVKENYYSLFFRKVSPDVKLEYQEL